MVDTSDAGAISMIGWQALCADFQGLPAELAEFGVFVHRFTPSHSQHST